MTLLPRLLLLLVAVFCPVTRTAAQDFPVTLNHAFGATTIPTRPMRIATIGWMAQDAVLALGQVPVGMPMQQWGGDENGVLPWVEAAIADLGGDLPTRYDDTQIPFEQLLVLAPDLILAPYSGLTAGDYDRLSQIAPTVAWTGAVWSGSWQEVTMTVGRALGATARAEELVAATNARIAAAAAAHPEFAGTTFTFAHADPAHAQLQTFVGTDPRVLLLEDLGLVQSPGAAALQGPSFVVPVSFEKLDTVAADVLITWQNDQAELDTLLANPLFARFDPVAKGSFIAMMDRSFVMATSAPSVLSLPWALDRLVPQLSAVLSR